MIKTQGIRYAGSKAKILTKIKDIVEPLKPEIVLDGFSGSTRVSQMLKGIGSTVHSNDKAIYSKVLAECYLMNRKEKSYYEPILDHLNNLKPTQGWFSDNYGGLNNNGLSIQSDGKKKPYQLHNTQKLDSIREEIDKMYPEDSIEKSVLLTSLLLSLDRVQNDLGHQVSYLKDWATKSFKTMEMIVPEFTIDNKDHKVYNKDIFDIDGKYDLAYLDPPYGTSNQRTPTTRVRYFSYYHLWTTIVKNDKPKVFGAAARREEFSSDSLKGAVSVFESTNLSVVEDSFRHLLESIDSKKYLISYSNRSKVPIDRLIEIVNDMSDFEVNEALLFPHKENSQTNSLKNGGWKTIHDEENMELLLLIDKNK